MLDLPFLLIWIYWSSMTFPGGWRASLRAPLCGKTRMSWRTQVIVVLGIVPQID